MGKKLLLLLNPKAGVMRGSDNFFEICKVFCDSGYDLSIRMTRAQGHATGIIKDEAVHFDKIVCAGGDGTLHEVVCGLQQIPREDRPPLGYIPTGTTNDFAQNFGLPLIPVKAAEHILEGEITDIDIGRFGEDGENNYFTYVASTGAFTDSSYRTPQNVKNAIGYMAYLIDGIAHLGSIKPVRMRITAGDQIFEGEYIFASVSNSRTVAKMIKIDKAGVDMTDGLFELILIKNPTSLKDANDIAKSLLTPNDPESGLVRAQASSITFELEEETAWTLDGEMAKAKNTFTVTNLHHELKFIT